LVCICGHDDHDWETKVCVHKGCYCIEFIQAIGDDSVTFKHSKYLSQMEKTENKIRYILTNIKYSRNFPNKQFVFFYWQIANTLIINKSITQSIIQGLDDPETIRRCKQSLVNKNQELYGPFELTLLEQKEAKQLGIETWLVQ
jgi:hypothetical protein